mmetsp:Transcript_5223/g.22158  ORF Transcript_5223/g.22158 Transcript_5223/m.22158 type:complete len:461 (+) Transcript_5223:472-1854(+)
MPSPPLPSTRTRRGSETGSREMLSSNSCAVDEDVEAALESPASDPEAPPARLREDVSGVLSEGKGDAFGCDALGCSATTASIGSTASVGASTGAAAAASASSRASASASACACASSSANSRVSRSSGVSAGGASTGGREVGVAGAGTGAGAGAGAGTCAGSGDTHFSPARRGAARGDPRGARDPRVCRARGAGAGGSRGGGSTRGGSRGCGAGRGPDRGGRADRSGRRGATQGVATEGVSFALAQDARNVFPEPGGRRLGVARGALQSRLDVFVDGARVRAEHLARPGFRASARARARQRRRGHRARPAERRVRVLHVPGAARLRDQGVCLLRRRGRGGGGGAARQKQNTRFARTRVSVRSQPGRRVRVPAARVRPGQNARGSAREEGGFAGHGVRGVGRGGRAQGRAREEVLVLAVAERVRVEGAAQVLPGALCATGVNAKGDRGDLHANRRREVRGRW